MGAIVAMDINTDILTTTVDNLSMFVVSMLEFIAQHCCTVYGETSTVSMVTVAPMQSAE